MRDTSHESPESASQGTSTNVGTTRPTEPQAEARPPGHRPSAAAQVPATLVPEAGWHFLHLFYRVDRSRLGELATKQRERGVEELRRVLVARDPGGPEQLQCFAVPGHKADFGVVMAGPDLRGVHDVQMSIQASGLGPALQPSYSFYSITEISEYVPDAEQYGRILRDREGLDPESSIYKTKVAAYADRLVPMNRQRLYPEFPNWP
jgi:chlorite dismutase